MKGKGWIIGMAMAAVAAVLTTGAGAQVKRKLGLFGVPAPTQPKVTSQPDSRPASLADPQGAFYVGTIGESAVQMSLLKTDKGLAGAYYFEKDGIPRSLSGKVDPEEGQAILSELSARKAGSRYVVRPDNRFEGTLAMTYWRFKGLYTPAGQPPVPFFLKKAATYVAARDNDYHCTAQSLYPVLTGETAAIREINRTIRNRMDKDRTEFLKVQAKECRDLAKDGNLPSGPFERIDTCTVRCFRPGLVSLLREEYEFAGGAHGNTTYTALNWQIEGGKATPFGLENLFREKSDWVKKIAQAVCQDLKRQKASNYMDGDPKKTEVPLEQLQTFYLTPQGITFVFDPYVAGCYAEGTFRVMLPWSKLEDLLDKNGPANHLRAPASVPASAPARQPQP